MSTKKFLIDTLYKIGAIQFGKFTLKSGQISPIYLNLRKIISYPEFLKNVSHLIGQEVQHYNFDLICGVPYTALPIATCLSIDYNIPMIMRRKEKKTYGTKQQIEGEFKINQQCLIIEDVVTTGSSILETAADLEQVGLAVNNVVALIDRQQGGRENLEKKYQFHSVLTLSEILKTLLNSSLVTLDEKMLIEQLSFADKH